MTANELEPNRLYDNSGHGMTPVWHSIEHDLSRGVAWGDWDNDGDLDLAVANEGDPNRVYENTGSTLQLAWSSRENDNTMSVAWADVDGDGDLDLAFGNVGQNRIYRNTARSW